MQEPPWMPRTEEEYRQQVAEDEAEEIGEMLERQRQPENQPVPELYGGPCWHGDSRSCQCEED